MCQIVKCSYYKNYCIEHNQILYSDRDPRVLTVCGLNMPQTNPRWRTAAILKNLKILISSQPIDQFWQNLIGWCVSTLWTLVNNKISWFPKSRWRLRPSWKFEKWQYLRDGTSDFDEIWYSDASGTRRYWQQIKIHYIKYTIWRRPPSWKIEKS